MNKIIISGANSFIGMELVKQLSLQGCYVYALVRREASRVNFLQSIPNVKVVFYSLEYISDIKTQIDEDSDTFIHLAWAGVRGNERNNKEIQSFNFKCAVEAFETARRLGCNTFVVAGSQAEYGLTNGDKINEKFLCKPTTEYGKNKIQLFDYLMNKALNYGIRVIEPRFFSIYGPYDYPNSLIISMINKLSINQECFLTEGTQWWDFLYVSDAVDALIKLLCCKKAFGAYNVAFGKGYPLRDFVEIMKTTLESQSILHFGAIPYPPEGKVDLRVDISLLKTVTGWEPKVLFQDGILLTYKYLQNNRMA